ncbi:MAG TPA: NAD-dependent epimerase/dehydratase family protein [Phycisphaerales bacterium]|nr:NAD-dependent epimerase/dehydratase family protein [Phycisphaerales bacterium]
MKLPADKVAQLRPFYSGRAVLVTGGAGFIGGHLVDALMSLGAAVNVIDDLSNSGLDHLAGLIELEPDRIRFTHASVLDDEALRDAAEGVRTVFHLAALGSVPRSVEAPQRTWSVNATGTVRVLEAARALGAERVVFAASSSAYGDQPELPKVETQPPRPMSPYAASKLAGEHLLATWSRTYGLSTVSLRYFNVFGPRQPADSAYAGVVAAFAKALLNGNAPTIYGDGEQTRDMTYVSSAVLGTLLAGAAPARLAGEAINIGTGRRVTVTELAAMMARACASPHLRASHLPERAGDVKHSLADIGLAKRVLGYEPIGSLEDGIAETVEWFRREGLPAKRTEGQR